MHTMKGICAAAALLVLCSVAYAGIRPEDRKVALAWQAGRGAKPAPAKPAAPPAPQFFTTPLTLDHFESLQKTTYVEE